MKHLKPIITLITIILLLTTLNFSVQAQKTTNVQETAVWAPDNIKIDGKLNEWSGNFQALNKATELYYTLANDDKNLYLNIRSVNQNAANKIVAGGINLIVNATGKKSDKDAVVITFPMSNISALIMPPVRKAGEVGSPKIDTELVAQVHKMAIEAAKEIKLIGIKEISDSVISVYNELGIKAAINYDAKGNLLYELSIPLKYLHLTDGVAFAYSIKLNGIGDNSIPRGFIGLAGGPVVNEVDRNLTNNRRNGAVDPFTGPGGSGPSDTIALEYLFYPTDFWGKYTLAKK